MVSNASGAQESNSEKFGRYVTHRLLGEGGMGRVYLAQDPVLEREVAVKVIALDRQLDDKTRKDYLSRFALEAKASAKLKHQSIIAVHDAGEERGVPWIAFEYVDGERLDEMIKHEGKLPVNEAVSIALDIASALQHAHSYGIIHRDVKPSNIIIEKDTGIAKLSDFGIVKAPWATLTMQGDVLGSPGYMSPEQISGLELDQRTDIFSLGVVLYEMISGKHPFLRDTVQNTLLATLHGKYRPLAELFPKIPGEVESAISKCLQESRDKRIQSAEEFSQLLLSQSSPATYQSHRTREALVGISQKIAQAIKKGTLNGGTKRILSAQVEGFSKFVYFLVDGIKRWLQVVLPVKKLLKVITSLQSRLLRNVRLSPNDETITFAAPDYSKGAGKGFLKILGMPFSALSKLPALMQYVLSRTWLVAVIISIITLSILIPLVWHSVNSNITIAVLQKRVGEGSLDQSLKAARELDKRGMSWSKYDLLSRGKKLLDQDNIELASMVAQTITKLEPGIPEGHIFSGRVALKSGEYEKARYAFVMAKKQENGNDALNEAHVQILADISQEFMRGRAQQSLINMAKAILTKEDEPFIRSWLQSEDYWLRWNTVAIMQAGNKTVDMVDIYIFDLKYGPDVETKINAVNELAEMRDKRAVPALLEAAGEKDIHPKVAHLAKSVLKNNFQ